MTTSSQTDRQVRADYRLIARMENTCAIISLLVPVSSSHLHEEEEGGRSWVGVCSHTAAQKEILAPVRGA